VQSFTSATFLVKYSRIFLSPNNIPFNQAVESFRNAMIVRGRRVKVVLPHVRYTAAVPIHRTNLVKCVPKLKVKSKSEIEISVVSLQF
jgi:hypothetical protein